MTLDLEKRHDELREKAELEKALIAQGKLFESDRLGQEVDALLNELLVRVANVASVKSVTFPDLLTRVERARTAGDEMKGARKNMKRELSITVGTATMTRDLIRSAFQKGDYAEVSSLSVAWGQFLRGKSVERDAQPILDEIKTFRHRAKSLSEFHQKSIHVTAVILNPSQPSQSVALVNGKSLRIGDAMDDAGQVIVQGISRDGVQFGFLGETIILRREDGSSTHKDVPAGGVVPAPVPVGEPAPRPGR